MDWDAWYDDVDEGWLTFLEQLRFAVTHQHEPCATPSTSTVTATEPTSAPAALGLDVDGDAGDRYDATVAGEHLTGEVWFRSAHQLGLTVDAWGPGLLVLADAPNGGGRAGSATLTTYGPIDGDRESRWTGVWRDDLPGLTTDRGDEPTSSAGSTARRSRIVAPSRVRAMTGVVWARSRATWSPGRRTP